MMSDKAKKVMMNLPEELGMVIEEMILETGKIGYDDLDGRNLTPDEILALNEIVSPVLNDPGLKDADYDKIVEQVSAIILGSSAITAKMHVLKIQSTREIEKQISAYKNESPASSSTYHYIRGEMMVLRLLGIISPQERNALLQELDSTEESAESGNCLN